MDEKDVKVKNEPKQKMTNKAMIAELRQNGYFVSRIPEYASGKTFSAYTRQFAGRKYRFGVVSCTHLGSKYQQLTHLYTFYQYCKRKRVDTVFHCGDLVDGEKMYRGQEYELFAHGADAQVDYAASNYPKIAGITTKAIMGNHDESFWRTSGINVVKAICNKRDDMDYLGDYLAYVEIDSIRIGIMHTDGGVPYARSYRLQKIIEQLSPEQKPHMLFVGHLHVTNHLPAYRNVEGVMLGCFQAQTPYLTRKGLAPVVSGVIVEIKCDDTGILGVTYEWMPFYRMVKEDF